MGQSIIVNVTESSQVFEARRISLELAASLGWDATLTGKVAIAATELGTNLAKHATGGELHVSFCERGDAQGIELLAVDRGPGLADPDASLRDGFSTAGTAGTGLGAVQRLSTEFDIYSQPGKGTALVARFYPASLQRSRSISGPDFVVGAVQVPLRSESVCGDSWGVRKDRGKVTLLVADGLGHGPGAAQASQEAVAVLQQATVLDSLALLETVHHSLRSTRGAAVAVASIDVVERQLTFVGIGNISAMLLNGSAIQHLVSLNGTAGHAVRKMQHFTYPWTPTKLLIMHSDGVNTNWRLEAFPGLAKKHPSLIAAVLYREASRGRDDACIVAARCTVPEPLNAE